MLLPRAGHEDTKNTKSVLHVAAHRSHERAFYHSRHPLSVGLVWIGLRIVPREELLGEIVADPPARGVVDQVGVLARVGPKVVQLVRRAIVQNAASGPSASGSRTTSAKLRPSIGPGAGRLANSARVGNRPSCSVSASVTAPWGSALG